MNIVAINGTYGSLPEGDRSMLFPLNNISHDAHTASMTIALCTHTVKQEQLFIMLRTMLQYVRCDKVADHQQCLEMQS